MISLCLDLCREVGFRPAETALKIVFDFLGIEAKLPSGDPIRTWACRVGVILGTRVCDLPPPGQTLSRERMHVLAVVPGTDWKRDDICRAYAKLVERIGPPWCLLIDGAVELRESPDALEDPGPKPVVLRDMKHFAANVFQFVSKQL